MNIQNQLNYCFFVVGWICLSHQQRVILYFFFLLLLIKHQTSLPEGSAGDGGGLLNVRGVTKSELTFQPLQTFMPH